MQAVITLAVVSDQGAGGLQAGSFGDTAVTPIRKRPGGRHSLGATAWAQSRRSRPEAWLATTEINDSPVFRPVLKAGSRIQAAACWIGTGNTPTPQGSLTSPGYGFQPAIIRAHSSRRRIAPSCLLAAVMIAGRRSPRPWPSCAAVASVGGYR